MSVRGDSNHEPEENAEHRSSPHHRAQPPLCNRCGFPVISRVWGCKNPCPNCHTVYPLGDCSD